jgi:cytochrome c-type biogenesis protein CcmH/NrfF
VTALWVIPSIILVIGASVVWRVSRQAAVEALELRQELAEWADARAGIDRLRAEVLEVGAGYRHLRGR